MYLTHFGLNEPPFRITPHTDFFFAGANRGAMLDALQYALLHDEGIIKVSGEVGSGKTMLCRVLMERLPEQVEIIYLANPSLGRDEILLAIADELQLDLGGERQTRVLRALQDALIQRYAEGRRVVVLIDEAHAMPPETLEEIRLPSNLEANRHKLLQIVLFGQPELDAHLGVAQMRQLKERITHSFRLGPLTRDEITSYIDYRMRAAGYRGPNVFTPGAMRLLADASEGLTRRVNILADKALLAAFAGNTHTVTEREVRRAIRDSEFYQPAPDRSRYGWLGVGMASGVILGAAVMFWFAREPGVTAIRTETRASAPVAPAPSQAPAATPAGISSAAPTEPASDAPKTEAAAARAAEPAATIKAASPPPAAAAPARPAAAAVPATANSAPQTAASETLPPARGALVKARYEETQAWLKSAPGNQYAIQLITVKASDVSRLENFLARASRLVPLEELHVYSVKIDGIQHYRAAYGAFPGAAATAAAIRELPSYLQAQNPYPRSIERMRSQNRQ